MLSSQLTIYFLHDIFITCLFLLARTSDIIQLAARCSDGTVFSRYMVPKQPITKEASRVTGLSLQSGVLCKNGEPVDTVDLKKCLSEFISYLDDKGTPLCLGHNIKSFDCHIIINHLTKCNLVEAFSSSVLGFVDTLSLFKELFPNMKSYAQAELARNILNAEYMAHDATEDVAALQSLVEHTEFSLAQLQSHSFSLESCKYAFEYSMIKSSNLQTFEQIVKAGAMTKFMAEKISGSGLAMNHIFLAFNRGNKQGIIDLFGENDDGKVRVTKSKKVIEKIAQYVETSM